MPSNALTHINRLMKEIANLKLAESKEAKNESSIQSRMNRAYESIRRTKSGSTLLSKQREIERALKDLARIQEKRASISKKIADKSRQLSQYESQRTREEERERKEAAEEQKRLIRERERHEKQVKSEIRRRKHLMIETSVPGGADSKDFFISHASEDKDSFVRDLARALKTGGASVWYDEFTLQVGDSLRREIERGLTNSRFGIVVLSTHFFAKEWPQLELDGLFSLDAHGDTRILPIWHQISKDVVLRHSPMLADRVALNTSLKTAHQIADELLKLV